jgi:hypothetical protein
MHVGADARLARRQAKSPPIMADHAAATAQRLRLAVPEFQIQRPAVHQQQCRSLAFVAVAEPGAVEVGISISAHA